MKRFLLILIMIGSLVIVVGCNNKKDDESNDKKIQTVTNIELDKEQYIEQLKAIKINGTEDTIKIDEKVKWEVPKHKKGETVSFSIAVPYTIVVDGKEYKGVYDLNDVNPDKLDSNPKYDFIIVNLTSEGDISIKITKKK